MLDSINKLITDLYEVETLKSKRLRHTLSFPFIMMMIVPLVFFDFFLEIYHRICFPLYRIPLVERGKYIRYDRHKLNYLNWLEKIFCAYCGYANGLVHYGMVIAGETEKYWCAIKHQKNDGFVEPPHHKEFAEFGDEKKFREIQTKFRKE